MRLTNSDYEYIKKSVVDLYKQYEINSFPIKPFQLVKIMGLKTIRYCDMSEKLRTRAFEFSDEGYSFEPKFDDWIIYYNNEFSRGTINNIIMHEIGHYWLGHLGVPVHSAQEESEASFFAKYSLTPPIIADKLLSQYTDRDFKDRFDLSWKGAKGAREYYNKWINRPNKDLKDYELDLLELLGLD